MIQGVIFDLDGVLVRTDELHYRAWKRLADREGIYFDRNINHRLRGVSRMDSLEIILARAKRGYSDAEKAYLAEQKNRWYRELLADLAPGDLLPGARAMLRALRERDVRTAIASASKNAKTIIERAGLVGWVDAVVDGHDFERSKPDPEVYALAADRLGLPPAACLVVEDAAAGIEAGRRAGMAVFGVGPAARLPTVARGAETLAEVTPEGLLAAGGG